MRTLSRDPNESWHIESEDWDHLSRYDDYLLAAEQMLETTDADHAPWTLVEATDPYWRSLKILRTVVEQLRARVGVEDGALRRQKKPKKPGAASKAAKARKGAKAKKEAKKRG